MKQEKTDQPKVSIIVVANRDSGLDLIFDLLRSFYPQAGDISYEFIVVDEQNEDRAKIYREQFPWVTLIQTEIPLSGSHFRNIALQKARGDIIVFWEDHVFVPKNYLKNLVATLSESYDIAGGPVENGNYENLPSWVQYFSEYHKWLPARPEGEVEDLPGCNFAYRADLLKRLGPFPGGRFKLESLFHEKAKKQGCRLYYSRGLQVAHFDGKSIRDIWAYRFHYGWLFAARRGFPLWKRFTYVVLSPVIALNEYLRIFNHARHDRIYLKKLIQCTPLLLPTLYIWMVGECFGYVAGIKGHASGDSEPHGDR
jgi:GT2 family glycosyltransferase